MKKIKVLLMTMLILTTLSFASFNDVPENHWASQAVKNLYKKGLLAPTMDNAEKFNGDGVFSRYEVAAMLYYNLKYFNEKIESNASAEDMVALKALTENFAPEISELGVKTEELDKRIAEIEKIVNKKMGRRITTLEDKVGKVNISGEYDIAQIWNSTSTQKGLGDLDYKGSLFINGKPSKNTKIRSKFSLEKGEKINVEALEFTADSKYGKLNIFKDANKVPASFQDPLGLFVAEKVKPTDGIIFKGKALKDKEAHTAMFYKTDAGDFYGIQSGYTLDLSKAYLGKYMLRGSYVEKVKDYFYDTNAEGEKVKETVDQYDKNMSLDFSYDNRSLFGVHVEGQIVDSEGMSVPSEELEDTIAIYGMAKAELFKLLKSEAGVYNAGKDFYSVAGDSNRDVFATAGDKIKNETDTKAYYLYSKLNLTKYIGFTGLYVNNNTQNKYDEPLEYMKGTGEINFGSKLKIETSLESEKEEFIVAEAKAGEKEKDPKLTFEPAITLRPMLGTKIKLSAITEIDPNEKVGKNDEDDQIKNEIELESDYSKGKIVFNNIINAELGAMTDNQEDKTLKTTITNKVSYDLPKDINLKLFDEFIVENNQEDKNMSGDGVENTLIVTLNKNIGSAKITLIGGHLIENKYAEDEDENGKANQGILLGAVYEYNYNSDTTLSISALSAGTISRDDDSSKVTGSMSYGEKFIEPADISVEEGSTINFTLSTKF